MAQSLQQYDLYRKANTDEYLRQRALAFEPYYRAAQELNNKWGYRVDRLECPSLEYHRELLQIDAKFQRQVGQFAAPLRMLLNEEVRQIQEVFQAHQKYVKEMVDAYAKIFREYQQSINQFRQTNNCEQLMANLALQQQQPQAVNKMSTGKGEDESVNKAKRRKQIKRVRFVSNVQEAAVEIDAIMATTAVQCCRSYPREIFSLAKSMVNQMDAIKSWSQSRVTHIQARRLLMSRKPVLRVLILGKFEWVKPWCSDCLWTLMLVLLGLLLLLLLPMCWCNCSHYCCCYFLESLLSAIILLLL
jgi:hypothetical protein